MASLTIRKLSSSVKEQLRVRAARHGHSMEEEVRRILNHAVAIGDNEPANAYEALRRHFSELDGVELELPERSPMREPPDFS